jgi:hypothetical protein
MAGTLLAAAAPSIAGHERDNRRRLPIGRLQCTLRSEIPLGLFGSPGADLELGIHICHSV